ncbi:MAG: ROK family protein, partial [Anaerovorax sp.]
TGVFEHMTIVPNGKPCYCGKNGCMDTYCSLNALVNENETLDSFFLKLRNENRPTTKRWKAYLEYLSIAIDNLHMLMDCDIILGGTLAQYLTSDDIDILHYYVQQQSAFPTKRKFIKISERAGLPVATGAALPYIMQFLDSALL